jgi:VIT1/CCC1 family predicted Fe2+/Mn2+ transporter
MSSTPSKNHPHDTANASSALNKLRAAVLGANDGVVSTSSVVIGVAAATNNRANIFTAGMAALVAGALSMAVGEYVSVSSQSDAEKAYITKERAELEDDPKGELLELTQAYVEQGVSAQTARQVAKELTAHNALKAHLQTEFNLDEEEVSNPTHAAVASLLSFALGGIIPFLTIIFFTQNTRIGATAIAVIIALFATGYMSAAVGNAPKVRAIVRVVIGGAVAMIVTYIVGRLFGTSLS